jgi:hypothetical protein
MILKVSNPPTDELEKAYLLTSSSAGAVTLSLSNNNRFAGNDRILIGEMGQEKSEIVTVSSVNSNGNDIVIGATKFGHSADDPVYKLRFDQVKYYRSTTTEDGVYSVISAEDLDVDNPTLETIYDDTAGLSSYFYKMTVFHSISTLESAFTDVISGGGWSRKQVGNIIDEILSEVSDKQETNITRTELLGYFNDVNDDLLLGVSKPYGFLRTNMTLARTANQNYVDYPVDSSGRQLMWKFDRMDYNFVDTTTDPDTDYTKTIPVMAEVDFRNTYTDNTVITTTVTDAVPEAMTLDETENRFLFSAPFETTDSDALRLYYWSNFVTISSEGDEIQTPTPKIYKLYAKAMYYRKRGVTESSYNAIADRFDGMYALEKTKYKGVDRKDMGTPRGFRPVNAVGRRRRR